LRGTKEIILFRAPEDVLKQEELREEAIKATDEAIRQLELCLKFDKD